MSGQWSAVCIKYKEFQLKCADCYNDMLQKFQNYMGLSQDDIVDTMDEFSSDVNEIANKMARINETWFRTNNNRNQNGNQNRNQNRNQNGNRWR